MAGQEPSAGEREDVPLAKEPSAGEPEGVPLAKNQPEGVPLAKNQPEGAPLARGEPEPKGAGKESRSSPASLVKLICHRNETGYSYLFRPRTRVDAQGGQVQIERL